MERFLRKCVTYQYPRHNCHGIPSRTEQRRLLVQKIRDCELEPLEAETLEKHPNCRRGRYLITGLDLDRGDERSFWWESMTEVQVVDPREIEPRPLRVVVVNDENRIAFERSFPDQQRKVYCDFFNGSGEGGCALAVS